MIYLVEHFFSIQGEGRYVGVPSIFLRFGGCNLKCPGLGSYEIDGERVAGCDTLRAVDRARFARGWVRIEEASPLIEIVASYLKPLSYRPDLVITGGEPMLYAHDSAMIGLLEWARAREIRVTIETNATIAPDFGRFPRYREVTFAMAVKLGNSGEPYAKRVVPEAIDALAKQGNDSFFKFTVDPSYPSTAKEIDEICAGYDNEIFCMPLGDDGVSLQRNAPTVAQLCIEKGFRYSDRLHVRLWNREEKR